MVAMIKFPFGQWPVASSALVEISPAHETGNPDKGMTVMRFSHVRNECCVASIL
jgi:hypothetical protein